MSTALVQGTERLKERLGPALAETDGGLVATPPDLDALAETMAIASEAGMRMLVQGHGLRLDWGNPVRADLTIATTALTRVLDYAPDDMVVTAEAGMTISDLNALLATRFQILPLEVPHPERTTLGGLVAAAPMSLARTGYGEVKDWLIGLSVVTPDGEVVKGGGKVVKNVAGYDLCKLYAGSLGTLGAIATVTFRVRPCWEATALLSARVPGQAAEAALEAVQTTALAPVVSALEVTEHAVRFTLGFDGFAETVDWQIGAATQVFEALGGEDLQVLRDGAALEARARLIPPLHGHQGFVVRCSVLPSDMLTFLEQARSRAHALGFEVKATGLAPHGTLWLQGNEQAPEKRAAWLREMRAIAAQGGGHATIEGRDGWPPVVDAFTLEELPRALMRRIQAGLDPRGLMAPGRFRLEGGAHGTP